MIEDSQLILEVIVTTGESITHTYPIIPYSLDDEGSVLAALDRISDILMKVGKLLAGQSQTLDHPGVAYNPAHIVRVGINVKNADDLRPRIEEEQRRIGFKTST